MALVRQSGTGPEMAVRRQLLRLGVRFTVDARDLPGRPDLVIRSARTVIFVHGCFWHRHRCRKGSAMPTTRAHYWAAKFERNVERDARARRALRRNGWRVVVVWECQTRAGHPLAALRGLAMRPGRSAGSRRLTSSLGIRTFGVRMGNTKAQRPLKDALEFGRGSNDTRT